MNPSPSGPGLGAHAVTISRVADHQWHAIENDLVVGRGHASRRLDGRTFVSIDTWRDDVFDQLAASILADQAAPLYTVVDEADRDLTASWTRTGFVTSRREAEFAVPTDLTAATVPPGVVISGDAAEAPLRELDRAIRAEVEAGAGWQTMPAEVLPWQGGTRPLHPSNYTVAMRDGRYVGLVRLATRTRRPRIGLIAVLAAEQRRGIGRALLRHALDGLYRSGFEAATAEVDQTNTAATALLEGLGARRTGSSLELVHRPGKA
ncbi:GNAT family N-acetyltransferase [Kribbella shirazensis]|uniref:Ribosomal protein S18 acetylase RimI-like enzyme n=1 Tax=Kribbella shirazensis TaxID=1105143 RepID=A0A7X5VCU4_9ACTN|nr:GNAT family N-acetyltransferase [Kribbella shirazensis]NIK58875.1 ribosomal protein S18 acetylase RimI-like enzyme [Kribbella shirazensis]